MTKADLSTFLLFLFACSRMQNDSNEAKTDFAQRYSCPEDRVTVKVRKDIDPANLLNPPVAVEPPPEVKKDPGRFAKWNSDKKSKDDETASGYRRSYTIYEAQGCEHHVLLACVRADIMGSSNGSVGTKLVCEEKPLP